MRERHAGNLHVQLISCGEVRDALASWGVFLGKVDLPLDAKLGPLQTDALLQRAQHTAVLLTGVAALEFFEQGDGIEPGIGLQQRDHFTVPNRTQWFFSGAPGSCGTLGRQALRNFITTGASLAYSGFGSRS